MLRNEGTEDDDEQIGLGRGVRRSGVSQACRATLYKIPAQCLLADSDDFGETSSEFAWRPDKVWATVGLTRVRIAHIV